MIGGPVGEAAGIYKKHGLDVTITGNGQVPEAMAAGKMDAGYIGTRGLYGANALGSPIVVAANNHIGGSMYLVVANDIEKPEDLLGKKIAMGDPSKSEAWQCGYGKILNLPDDPEAYELVNIGSDADKYVALSTGQIDAYTCCDPWGSMAQHEGVGKIMATYLEMDERMGVCCAFSLNKNFIKDHPDLAKELVLAHTESIQYVYKHPYKAAEIFSEYFGVPLEVSIMTIYKKIVAEGRTLTWDLTHDNFEHAYHIYEKYDLLEKLPEYENVVYEQILAECGAEDFDTFIKEEIDPILPVGMTYEEFKKKAMEIDGIDE